MRASILSLAFFTLIACGQSSESTRIRIDAGFTTSSSLKSSYTKGVTIGTDCYQSDLYLLVHDPIQQKFAQRKAIKARTKLISGTDLCQGVTSISEIAAADVSTNINLAISCLSSPLTVIDEPLEINFAKGTAVEVGIAGTFYPARDDDSDGYCDKLDANAAAPHTYSVLGHTLIPADYEVDGTPYPLSLNVLKSTPSVEYSMTIANIPSVRDWVKLDRIFYTNELREVRYLPDANGEFLIRQKINPLGTTPVFIPHIFPLQLIFKSTSTLYEYSYVHTGGSVAGTTITACKVGADCSDVTNQMTYTYQLTTY